MRAVADAHIAALKPLTFVQSIEREDNRLSLALDNPDATTPLVVRALVQAGSEIQSVGEEKHSLEDVYLNLVGNGGGKK